MINVKDIKSLPRHSVWAYLRYWINVYLTIYTSVHQYVFHMLNKRVSHYTSVCISYAGLDRVDEIHTASAQSMNDDRPTVVSSTRNAYAYLFVAGQYGVAQPCTLSCRLRPERTQKHSQLKSSAGAHTSYRFSLKCRTGEMEKTRNQYNSHTCIRNGSVDNNMTVTTKVGEIFTLSPATFACLSFFLRILPHRHKPAWLGRTGPATRQLYRDLKHIKMHLMINLKVNFEIYIADRKATTCM